MNKKEARRLRKYCTKQQPSRFIVPFPGHLLTTEEYVKAFSKLNNLKLSPFIISGKEVMA